MIALADTMDTRRDHRRLAGPPQARGPAELPHAARRPGHPAEGPADGEGAPAPPCTRSPPPWPSPAPTASTGWCWAPTRARRQGAPGHRLPGPGLQGRAGSLHRHGHEPGGGVRPGRARSTRSACPGRWSRWACSAFAAGLETLMVIEHKRGLIEPQARAALYDLPAHACPRIIGKTDETGAPLLSELGSLSVAEIALAIYDRLPPGLHMERAQAYLNRVSAAGVRSPSAWPPTRPASRSSARAARTTPRPSCPRAAAPWPASAATTWPGSTTR